MSKYWTQLIEFLRGLSVHVLLCSAACSYLGSGIWTGF